MRLSQDRDSWKAGSIIRRDFRSDRAEPESPRWAHATVPVPRPKHRISCALSPTGVHTPEHYAAQERRTNVTRKETTWLQIYTTWQYRCRYCHTSDIAPRLLGPVADILTSRELQQLLAYTWCRHGHLFEVAEVPHRYSYLRTKYHTVYYEKRCLMCGKAPAYSSYAVTDRSLLAAAGVPSSMLDYLSLSHYRQLVHPSYQSVQVPPKEAPDVKAA